MRAKSQANVRNTLALIVSAALLFLVSMLVIFITSRPVLAQQPQLTDFPFLVDCTVAETQRAFYLSTLNSSGVAVYISPDRQAGMITATGVASPVSGDAPGDCSGKTLKELRDAGQAFDLKR